MTEEMDWINQSQQGNDEAFTHLVEVYQTPVYNLCYRMLGEVGGRRGCRPGEFPQGLPKHPAL